MENSVDNKQKILDTALELFSQKGFDAVGVQLLCEKSGITKPTLYYYFGNKEGLFIELLEVNYKKLNKMLSKRTVYKPNINVYEKDVFPVLVNIVKGYFEFARNNNKFYKMLLLAQFYPVIKEYNDKQYDILETMFKKMSQVHGNMRNHEKRLAWTFIGMINTYIGLGETVDGTAETAVHQFMHGIFS